MHVSAPAKINLHLRVGPPRADGFHPLLSWMCTVGIFDELTFTPATQTSLSCGDPSIPSDSRNLVLRAAELLRGEVASQHVAIALDKQIPYGGGLGGGSSDAAATLSALNECWKLNLPRERLRTLAATIGSDVPFFLFGPSSVCRGRGEVVQPIAPPRPRAAVLILPGIALPTPAVYRTFDQLRLGDEASLTHPPDWQNWTRRPAAQLLPDLANDLEPAAFHLAPQLGRLRVEIEQTVAQPVRMSGSGSSLFTLVDESDAAADLARSIRMRHAVDARSVRLAV